MMHRYIPLATLTVLLLTSGSVKATLDLIRGDVSQQYVTRRSLVGQNQPKPLPPSPPKPVDLIFSKRTQTDPISGLKFPADMPDIRYPTGYDSCNAEEVKKIKEAWALGHFYMWRSNQVMSYLARHDSQRKNMWMDGYDPSVVKESGQWRNYSPRAWFGPYDGDRFQKVSNAIEKVFNDRFQGKTFRVKCRTNDNSQGAHPCYQTDPATGNTPSANHIVYGTINFCNRWFRREDAHIRARGIVHEVFHWLRIPGTGVWVTDLHTHCDGLCKTEKMYGREKASHLAHVSGIRDGHYERAIRNNDNYAIFAYMLGRKIFEGDLTQFPSPGFFQ